MSTTATARRIFFTPMGVWDFCRFTAGRSILVPATRDETGTGTDSCATVNLPISFGTPRQTYRESFAAELEKFAGRFRPQLILISAGFDSHRADPIGSLGLEVEDFAELTKIVRDVAAVHAEGRIVSVLEGGYNPPVLAECVDAASARVVGRPSLNSCNYRKLSACSMNDRITTSFSRKYVGIHEYFEAA